MSTRHPPHDAIFPMLWQHLAELATLHGRADTPNTLWVLELLPNRLWILAANGDPEPLPYTDPSGITYQVPPGSVWVQCDGWPAGIIDMNGATLPAGTNNNAAALLRAMRDHIRHVRWARGMPREKE